MTLTLAAWLVIVGALILANLPFVIERPLVPWPWAPASRHLGGAARWTLGLGFLAAFGLWSWATVAWVGGAIGGVGALFFLLKLVLSIIVVAALLAAPGWVAGHPPLSGAAADTPSGKSFFDRLLETLLGYVLVGTLGFALELDLGNAFPQGWEFYAVTLTLFLVLAYPGFVWRYLIKRRRR